MQHPIYPCLWFNSEAKEAAEFYCSVFKNSSILASNPMVTTFSLDGLKVMGLNGGPMYQTTQAVSLYVYAGNEEEVTRLFNLLSEHGKILMPLDTYAWSSKYAWVEDKFGNSWQLDVKDIEGAQKIVPCLLFVNKKMGLVKKAITHYTATFKDATIRFEAPYPTEAGLEAGTLLFAQYVLNGTIFQAMSSTLTHDFDFTPGNSLVIDCDTQDEIDHYWEKLGKNGRYDRCGWLADEFGVSWQVVPTCLSKLMKEKGQRVVEAFMKMQKFDIKTLEEC
jgi:predicted 3-demethylubiquinone-9 3-methyltransferase (glyoxalase superfamily)